MRRFSRIVPTLAIATSTTFCADLRIAEAVQSENKAQLRSSIAQKADVNAAGEHSLLPRACRATPSVAKKFGWRRTAGSGRRGISMRWSTWMRYCEIRSVRQDSRPKRILATTSIQTKPAKMSDAFDLGVFKP